ncbi:LLM class flavin-dependent oxidoreductase [Cellulomonas shaoxiangyii]|uniref:LLM class flavin-dependent oxidoreductase n=1 Tax=Cellulomonas shaoxiangyii TaxID=2566013 RepID=UPI0026C44D69
MPDYGHPLRFGSFITPTSARPQHAVDLAVLSEDLGLDLVTFQDHPYEPSFLDTWTLLSWVAARTTRIAVSGNVLNVTLRPPAVLSRAVASLSLLSGGRVELAIGAGGFTDAVVAFGAPRRTVGQSLVALDEAIDVIRGLWDAGDPTPLRVLGEHYRIDGARRGPRLPAPIPIAIGAYRPRMVALTGRQGDAWLPSLPWLQPGGLAEGNRIIDEAAVGAGRAPGEIRRMLNIPPGTPTEVLVRAAVDHGVSTFILATDEPELLRELATQTATEVRERVGDSRAGATASGRSLP